MTGRQNSHSSLQTPALFSSDYYTCIQYVISRDQFNSPPWKQGLGPHQRFTTYTSILEPCLLGEPKHTSDYTQAWRSVHETKTP